MSPQRYLEMQHAHFVRALNHPARYPVGVRVPEDSLPFGELEGSWEWDSTEPPKIAFLRRPKCDSFVEYWINVECNNYRKLFLRHLKLQIGLDSSIVHGNINVDHVLHRAFARQHGISYVRLSLLPSRQNATYGAKFEKLLLRCHQNSRHIYLPDFCICLKMLDIKMVSDEIDYLKRREQIASQLVSSGILPASQTLIAKALDDYFRWWPIHDIARANTAAVPRSCP